MNKKNEIIIFENQNVKLEVNMQDETVWLNRQQIAKLFEVSLEELIWGEYQQENQK